MGRRYHKTEDGEWIIMKDPSHHVLACCDCGLVHEVEFRAVPVKTGGNQLAMRVRRNERATAQKRRHMFGAKKDRRK